MPSPSPLPGPRPLMHDSISTASLSSSGMPAGAGAGATKQPRPHLVSRHSRNVSHGRPLSNMPKKSMSQVYQHGDGRNHRRAKSGNITPSDSPKTSTGGGSGGGHMKRNSSHVILPRNRSAGNLRKNQSTNTLTALNRNLSRGALRKLGAPADQKAKQQQQQKQGVFDLGNASSEDEEEAEWEDSTASPELTRDNSKVNTPARVQTPNGEPIQKPPDQETVVPEKTSSPPSPVVLKNNKSAPNLRHDKEFTSHRPRHDPTLLQPHGRSSRAPPAMITANARSSQQDLARNNSQQSLIRSNRTSLETSKDSTPSAGAPKTPSTSAVGTSSSGSAGVSHFLNNDPTLARKTTSTTTADSDDDVSISDFMATYRPQPSESPNAPRTNINKAKPSSQPSRTQQKLDLQRREVMRGSGPPPTSGAGLALSAGSSVSLHSRSASKGRNRSLAGEYKAIKQDYENSVKQLTVVRRFRNPILESLGRMKQAGIITAVGGLPGKVEQKRPPSRHGHGRVDSSASAVQNSNPNTVGNGTAAGTTDHTKTVTFRPSVSRPAGSHRDGHVQFQLSRQGIHDDILTTSAGSPDTNHDDLDDGLSPGEALIRRMWESRIHVA